MASELVQRSLAPIVCKDGKPHHWVLATPAGATVRGKCKRCKAVRQYASAFEEKKFNFWVGGET